MTPPELPTTVAARSFVRGTALLSLVMAGVSVGWSVLQLLVVVLSKPADLLEIMQFMLPPGMAVPPLMLWLANHAVLLSLLLLVLSLAFGVVSWGLLTYRKWGQIGFIVFLIAIALANFALLPICDRLLTDSIASFFPADFLATSAGSELAAHIQGMRGFMWVILGSTMLLIAGLHAWLVFKLQRPPVRTLFY